MSNYNVIQPSASCKGYYTYCTMYNNCLPNAIKQKNYHKMNIKYIKTSKATCKYTLGQDTHTLINKNLTKEICNMSIAWIKCKYATINILYCALCYCDIFICDKYIVDFATTTTTKNASNLQTNDRKHIETASAQMQRSNELERNVLLLQCHSTTVNNLIAKRIKAMKCYKNSKKEMMKRTNR